MGMVACVSARGRGVAVQGSQPSTPTSLSRTPLPRQAKTKMTKTLGPDSLPKAGRARCREDNSGATGFC